jgi:hypothetical protein
MIGVLGQVGWCSGLMCFDVIERIVSDSILALGSEVIENLAHQCIKTHPPLLRQAFQLVELRVGQFQDKCAHGLLPLLFFYSRFDEEHTSHLRIMRWGIFPGSFSTL